jgi:transmembrane sensor
LKKGKGVMMSKLPLPLSRVLRDDAPDAAEVERLWAATRVRLAPRPRRRAWLYVPSLALAALLVFVLARRLLAPAGPLLLADGHAVGELAGVAPRTVAFNDGSRVELQDGALLQPTRNDATATAFQLRRGRARFELAGARRYTIDTGLALIQVSGARFAVFRDEATVEVMVFEGMLIVRGDEVPGHERQLGRDEQLRLGHAPLPPPPVAPAKSDAPATPTEMVPETVPATAIETTHRHRAVPRPSAPQDWRVLAHDKKFDEAYDALGERGLQAASRNVVSMDDLLQLADVARLSGHPADALPALERAVREFPEDRRAGLAAYTQGRIHADELHQARHGADAFAQAIGLGLPEALSETAYLRLVETRWASGDRAGAEEAARQYATRFPSGRFGDKIKAVVEGR